MQAIKKSLILLVAVALLLPLCGCRTTGGIFPRGLIYTHTIEPLDLNLTQTPQAGDSAKEDIKHFQIDVVNLAWDSNAIGDIVRRHGIDTVYCADLETFRILGIWNQYKVHVYGK